MKKIRTLDPAVVIQNAQLKALESMLTKTPEFFERKVRRWFSRQYSTAYMATFDIPWEEILLHYYESNIESMPFNDVYDLAVSEYLPEFVQAADQEDAEFAKSLEKEQEATVQAKKQKDAHKAKLDAEAQRLANASVTVADKVQSLNKALDKHQNTQPQPKAMSLRFDDEGDPDKI